MLRYLKFYTLFILTSITPLLVTSAQDNNEGQLTGVIQDQDGQPLSNVTVAVYDSTGTELVDGESTGIDGSFRLNLERGSYLVEISFLSYKKIEEQIEISAGITLNLGTIVMEPTTEALDEVIVRGERSQMELSFDKRIFNVGKDLTSLGGSALDILDNVPSISIDIDGNVSLRGNQGVRILINGKPSNLVSDGADALRSFSADMIKEVEIITNPSSRYAAEGSAGIINIILKKQRDIGVNGNVSAGSGLPDQYEVSTNFNYRTGNVNWFFNGGAEYESEPESGSSFQRFAGPDTTYMFRENSDADENEVEGTVRLGVDIFPKENQTFTISSSIDVEREENDEEIVFTDMEFEPNAFSGDIIRRFNRDNIEIEKQLDLDFDLDYEVEFNSDDHSFTADAGLDISNENADTDIRESILQGTGNPLIQRSDDNEREKDFRFNAEYVRPLGDGGKLEAGFRSDTEWSNTTDIAETLVDGVWVSEPAFNNNFRFRENVNAAYLIYGKEIGDFSGQLGLRMENTRIKTELKETGDIANLNTTNFFPSLFLNYSFNEQQSVQFSYSRRLSRPRSRELLPTVDLGNNRSQFTGNPDLTPEFSNSFELGFLQYWNTGSVLTSVYFRKRSDVIEDITLQEQGIINRFPINLATEEAWGLELTADQKIGNSVSLNGSLNLFRSDTNGSFQDQVFRSESGNFQSRFRVQWELTDEINFQSSMRFRAPNNTTQGSRNGRKTINSAISKEILDGKALISFNVRDLFDSRSFDNTVTTDGNPNTDFFSDRTFSFSSREFTVNFRYFFGSSQRRR